MKKDDEDLEEEKEFLPPSRATTPASISFLESTMFFEIKKPHLRNRVGSKHCGTGSSYHWESKLLPKKESNLPEVEKYKLLTSLLKDWNGPSPICGIADRKTNSDLEDRIPRAKVAREKSMWERQWSKVLGNAEKSLQQRWKDRERSMPKKYHRETPLSQLHSTENYQDFDQQHSSTYTVPKLPRPNPHELGSINFGEISPTLTRFTSTSGMRRVRRNSNDEGRSPPAGNLKKLLNSKKYYNWEAVQASTAIWFKKRGRLFKHELAKEEAVKVKRVFDALDEDGSGMIELDELLGAFRSVGITFSKEEWADLLPNVDPDKSGSISLGEFSEVVTNQSIISEHVALCDLPMLANTLELRRTMESVIGKKPQRSESRTKVTKS